LGTRFVVLHFHILKNGGSTIESVLQREFSSGFAKFDGSCPNSVLDETDLIDFLQQHPDITAISSHHLRYPKPAIRGTVFFDCCFLRHPLDRLLSLHAWSRKIDTPDPICRVARTHNPREFAHRLLNEFPHMASNVQVTHLANAGAFLRPANENDLETANRVIMEMAMPGLVELFNESLVAAEYFLHPAFPGIRLDSRPRNVSRPGERHHPDREQELEDKLLGLWGDSIYSDLLRLNQFDMELYRRTYREVERRLFLVPRLNERMADFEARCAGPSPSPSVQMMELRLETSAAHR
jgi:hypothetical protein